jgi:hypothetical protein
MEYAGAELHLRGGDIRISTESITFPSEFGYGDNENFLKFFVLSYIKLLCDSPLKESHGDKPMSTYYSFIKLLTRQHLAVTIKLFSGYSHDILSNEYSTGSDSSTRVFHEFMLDTPIFKEYHMWLKTGRPDLLKFVLSFLLFGKKLEYEDPDFDATAFRGWLEVEEKLRTLVLADEDVDIIRNIINAILPPLKVDVLLPKFGPGKVAERGVEGPFDKLNCLRWTPRLRYAFDRERPGRSRDEGFTRREAIVTQGDQTRDSARQKFVPKDITKSRTISMEPNTFMYFQQEVMRWMVNSMDDGLISRFVTLRDQTTSQNAAVHGSLYFSTDTIDLSSASDSVSLELVRRVFPPDWLFFMLATRSSRVELYDGSDTISAYKFAPMGSAICFPTQCIIFTAVCIYAAMAVSSEKGTGARDYSVDEVRKFILTRFWKSRSSYTPFTGKYEPPVVYGDDIAVDSRTTGTVTSILDRLGFTVNRSKSFTGSQSFRESCGVFAFEGLDVTPVMFRLPFFTKGRWDTKVYASFIGSINWLRDNFYHHVASFYLSALKRYGFRYPLPFSSRREDFGLYTKNKHSYVYEAHVRWNADWQVTEVRIQGIEARSLNSDPGPSTTERRLFFNGESLSIVEVVEPIHLQVYKLDQWWRQRIFDEVTWDESHASLIRPQETRLAPRWARRE